MFGKRMKDKLDKQSLNEVIVLSKKILQIAFFLIIIVGIYAITMILKEWKILNIFINIFKILTPLFIGLIIAWLFNPLVTYLQKKRIKRGIGAGIVYIGLILIITFIISSLIPLLSKQINEFAKTIPSILNSVTELLNDVLLKLSNVANFDVTNIQAKMSEKLAEIGNGLTNSLPSLTVGFVKNFFSGIGTFVVGLIIGFYLLVSFDNASDMVVGLFPKRIRNGAKSLLDEINVTLKKYVQGTFILSSMVFACSSIGFLISGLKAPLLFGLFCGITDIIPFIGPYIGGIPAVIVGFSQSMFTGIATLIAILITQFIEGNFLQPLIMSKQLKLHPVTIMVGLLIFGYLFGIIGMVLASPIMAIIKVIFNFADEKYNIKKSLEDA